MKKPWTVLKTLASAGLMLFGGTVGVLCYYVATGFDSQAVQRLVYVLQAHVTLERRRSERLVEEIRQQIREARKQAIEEARQADAETLNLIDLSRGYEA